MAENTVNSSSYVFVMNNPIIFIDPDGNDWFYYADGASNKPTWHWHEGDKYKTGVKNDKGDEIVLTGVEAVVVFEGSRSEKLGEGQNLKKKGAVLAKVTVYGPMGEKDISTYRGYTMSSDPKEYARVKEGMHYGNYDKKGKSGSLKSNWTLENRGRVRAQDNENPYRPNQVDENGAYLTGVFIHRSNMSGYAGPPVSKGCLIIHPDDWEDFKSQIKGVKDFRVQVIRDGVGFGKPMIIQQNLKKPKGSFVKAYKVISKQRFKSGNGYYRRKPAWKN